MLAVCNFIIHFIIQEEKMQFFGKALNILIVTLFISFFAVASTVSLSAKNTYFLPSENEYFKALFPSTDRYVESLSGDWEKVL